MQSLVDYLLSLHLPTQCARWHGLVSVAGKAQSCVCHLWCRYMACASGLDTMRRMMASNGGNVIAELSKYEAAFLRIGMSPLDVTTEAVFFLPSAGSLSVLLVTWLFYLLFLVLTKFLASH